ncbi:MAG TPA: type III secretion HpaP family protein [Albitalea sp.]|uniref:type III secretion HpaP family protein n=1 Tax=Piscinibacter sp. TaxID=1903157 RepID=UPI002ED69A0C
MSSSADIRRPRRIIEGPAPAAPAGQPSARHAERFQRALLQDRRGASTTGRNAPGGRDAARGDAVGSASARAPATGAAEPRGETSQACVSEPAQPVAAVEPAWTWVPPPDPPTEPAAGEERAIEPHIDPWTSDLVHVIATLCARTDPAIEAWTVTLPMDPRLLPQTELQLSLSRHRISLRFQTQSGPSLELLSRHRSLLAAMLQQALSQSREIDIELG